MTSRRAIETALRSTRFTLVAAAAALLGACAALPDDAPVVEQLETETGITVTRLGHPVELYRETFQQEAAGRFAFIGPFETNLMGSRELFVWLAVPVEPVPDAVPIVEVNGSVLTLGVPGRAADFAGLQKSPYKIPTPWSATYYFKVDEAVVARLGEATDVSVRVTEPGKNGPIKTLFAVKFTTTPHLKDFATR
ncbi:MAG TPA: hypothetical protein VFU13_02935 [Steroidobacteraceae bacterium]|nr:hypothetical protein [Steroidobacteraceae bacterium]